MRLSRDPAARRRLVALAVAAFVALIAGIAAGAGGGGGSGDDATAAPERPSPRAAARELPLERQVGQLLVMAFDEATVPEYIRRRLSRSEGTGVILFGGNVAPDAEGLRALTDDLQRAARGSALVMTDQEGGEIRNVPFAAPEQAPATVTDPEVARDDAAAAARDLRGVGINVNLAPVLDVAAVEGSVLAGRAYPGGPEEVSALGAAAVEGHQRGRVGATIKHFPGLGSATVNTDDGSATIESTREALDATDLPPFRAAIEAGAPLVMSSHALYTALDPESIASQSTAVLEDLLRGELGFDGAVITDSIEAQAVLDRSDVATAAERSVEAGNDLVLMTGSGSWNLVYPRLLERARSDPEFRARVDESAARVLALKRRLGLRAPPGLG
jgi:beta-N-acetylhexosaminidase